MCHFSGAESNSSSGGKFSDFFFNIIIHGANVKNQIAINRPFGRSPRRCGRHG